MTIKENDMSGHIHAELMAQYAEDARETETPWERWECSDCEGRWSHFHGHPMWSGHRQYRRKPRTITINWREVPEPMREAPDLGGEFYLAAIDTQNMFCLLTWGNSDLERRWLSRGLIHSSKEAAIAHAEALLSFAEAK